jgi:hypothetical protein
MFIFQMLDQRNVKGMMNLNKHKSPCIGGEGGGGVLALF